jgi:hypothetical protein
VSDSPDLSKRLAPGRLTPDVEAAHQRLASLPTVRYSREDALAAERVRRAAELSESLRRARLSSASEYVNTPRRDPKARKGILHGPNPTHRRFVCDVIGVRVFAHVPALEALVQRPAAVIRRSERDGSGGEPKPLLGVQFDGAHRSPFLGFGPCKMPLRAFGSRRGVLTYSLALDSRARRSDSLSSAALRTRSAASASSRE